MPEFPPTHWTEIRAAHSGDSQAMRAFVEKYRPPVVAYLARRGLSNDAEDLAQEVFLRFLSEEVLGKADPARGRFRGLVMAVTRHVLGHHLERQRTLKRGGGEAVLSLNELDLTPTPDDDFDREWVGHLLGLALGRLEREHANYHEALRRSLLEEESHEQISKSMACTKGDVSNWVHRGRKKVVSYLQEEVRRYTSSEAEYLDELQQLSRLLPI
jgi:RNA polymerase sigma factor (sigma-70 family)